MRVFLILIVSTVILSAVAFIIPASSSTPHRTSSFIQASPTSTVTTVLGTVKWFNVERGYGFIALDSGGPDIYVHATGLTFDGPLVENECVIFISEIDKRTNKPKAVNVSRTTAEVAPTHAVIMTSIDEPSVSLVDELMESVSKELDDKSSIKMETFQRARFAAQLRQAAAKSLALRAAEEYRLEQEAEECRLAEETTKAAARAAATDVQLAKEAEKLQIASLAMKRSIKEEKFQRSRLEAQVKQMEVERIAEAKAAEVEVARIAESARIAEEMRLAEEAAVAKAVAEAKAAEVEAARIAEEMQYKKLEESEALELGFPSAAIMKKRLQPKLPEEEAVLSAKYGAMSLGEKAFAILTDLGMIDLNSDPNDPSRDTSKDDDNLE